MATQQFRYVAFDAAGTEQKGEVAGENEHEVVALLRRRGLTPVKVEAGGGGGGELFSRGGVTNRDLIDFTSGLTTMVETRVPLDRALGLLEGLTEKPAVNQLIADLRRDVKGGKSLAQAMQAHPKVFSNIYVNLVRAGEEGGILDRLLPKLERFLAEADETRRHIVSSLIYPAILFVVGILSVILLLVFVVPQFASLFEDSGTGVPPSAAFLLALSDWLVYWGWTLPLIPFGAWFGWRRFGSTPEGRERRDRLLLSLPLMGQLLLEAEAGRFCRTLGALLGAGIPMLKGLHITRGVMDNQQLIVAMRQIEEQVRGGKSLGQALGAAAIFPQLLSQLVIVGEESGRTAQVLDKLAETFDAQVKQQMMRLVAFLEPFLILLLGIFVGGIVIAMLSAVFSINDVNL
ncbi:type II secretion system F family protein [Endothiovibrio diazotrophicus]